MEEVADAMSVVWWSAALYSTFFPGAPECHVTAMLTPDA